MPASLQNQRPGVFHRDGIGGAPGKNPESSRFIYSNICRGSPIFHGNDPVSGHCDEPGGAAVEHFHRSAFVDHMIGGSPDDQFPDIFIRFYRVNDRGIRCRAGTDNQRAAIQNIGPVCDISGKERQFIKEIECFVVIDFSGGHVVCPFLSGGRSGAI